MNVRYFFSLILAGMLALSGCFKQPVAPKLPSWETPLTFPLLDRVYDLVDLQNDSTITVTDTSLGHLAFVFSDTMESVGITTNDLRFASSPPITIPPLNEGSTNLSVTRTLSQIDRTPSALNAYQSGDTVLFFPASNIIDAADTIEVGLPSDVPFFKSISRYTVDQGQINFTIDNSTPLPLDIVRIQLTKIDGTLIQEELDNIPPYTEQTIVLDLSGKELTNQMRFTTYITNEEISNEVLQTDPGITLQPAIDISDVKTVTGVTKDTTYTDTIKYGISNPDVRLKRGRLHDFLGTPAVGDSNALALENWLNYIPADLVLDIEFSNIYAPGHPAGNSVTILDTLLAAFYNSNTEKMEPSPLVNRFQYPYSLSRDTIRSITPSGFLDSLQVVIQMEQIASDDPRSSVGEEVTMVFPIDNTIEGDVTMKPLQFDRIIAAIEKQFPPIEQTIDKIPEGFSGLGFQKVRLITNFYNQIPIDTVLLQLQFVGNSAVGGQKVLDLQDVRLATPVNTDIGNANYAYTEIVFRSDSLVRVFHGGQLVQQQQTNLAIQDLLNDVPDSIQVSANATLNGTATLTPGDSLWGDFAMEAPFFVAITDTMRFIPVDSTQIDTLQPDTRAQLKNTLSFIELRTDIENHLGFQGAMSLLVSNKGLFPLLGTANTSDSTFQIRNDSLYINGDSIAYSFIDTLFRVTLPAINRFTEPGPEDSIDYNFVAESGFTMDTTIVFDAADTTKVNILTSDMIYYTKPLIQFYPTPQPISIRPEDYISFRSRVTFRIKVGD